MLLFYYLVLPVLLGYLVIKLIKSSGALEPAEHIKILYATHPIEKRMFRAARVDGGQGEKTATFLGDFENLSLAVDAIYVAKEQAAKDGSGARASFIALNDKMETLEEI